MSAHAARRAPRGCPDIFGVRITKSGLAAVRTPYASLVTHPKDARAPTARRLTLRLWGWLYRGVALCAVFWLALTLIDLAFDIPALMDAARLVFRLGLLLLLMTLLAYVADSIHLALRRRRNTSFN